MKILNELQLKLQEQLQEHLKRCSKTKRKNCNKEIQVIHKMEKMGSLVPIAKSSAVFEGKKCQKTLINQRSIEVSERDEFLQSCLNFKQFKNDDFQQDFRLLRFLFQRISREILFFCKNKKGKKWRTVDCLWSILASHVSVLHSLSVNKAHFGNLATCGSVWVCPVCSSKISERRRAEIVNATNLHKAVGGGLYMVTMTWGHSRHDDLAKMVKSSREALIRLRKQWAYVQNSKVIDYVGMIRAFEVTYGDANGWHPHFHELWFLKKKLTARQLQAWNRVLFEEWRAQCLKAGLGEPNREVGITIIEAESAAEYVAKFGKQPCWDVGSELTKHQKKHGRKGSLSPWDFLRSYGEGQERFGQLFREYANAFFGARQVYWSNGLKRTFEIQELNDEEIARMYEEDAYELCEISKEDWKKILGQSYEARTLILKLAEIGGANAVESFIGSL